jgi:carbon storage regulator
MLILSRLVGQKIFVGPDIVIHIYRIGDGKVRIGIEAPRGVVIEREELIAPSDPRRVRLGLRPAPPVEG